MPRPSKFYTPAELEEIGRAVVDRLYLKMQATASLTQVAGNPITRGALGSPAIDIVIPDSCPGCGLTMKSRLDNRGVYVEFDADPLRLKDR